MALVPEASYPALLAETLMAKAEVKRFAGARHQATDSLRAALRIYEDRHAGLARTALASLTAQPGTKPA